MTGRRAHRGGSSSLESFNSMCGHKKDRHTVPVTRVQVLETVFPFRSYGYHKSIGKHFSGSDIYMSLDQAPGIQNCIKHGHRPHGAHKNCF